MVHYGKALIGVLQKVGLETGATLKKIETNRTLTPRMKGLALNVMEGMIMRSREKIAEKVAKTMIPRKHN